MNVKKAHRIISLFFAVALAFPVLPVSILAAGAQAVSTESSLGYSEPEEEKNSTALADGNQREEIQFNDPAFYQAICRLLGKSGGQPIYIYEVEGVKTLDIISLGISDLTGIEYFTGLEVLYCNGNFLTSLDLTNNPALAALICESNRLTGLDVSGNPALTYLSCGANRLADLNVSNNPALEALSCCENKLTGLDVSSNPALKTLDCYGNELTGLDVSNNPALTSLQCEYNALTSLDLSNNPALTALSCYKNALTGLDVSNNSALISLDCSYNRLRGLDLTYNRNLRTLYCDHNYIALESNITGIFDLSLAYYRFNPQNEDPEAVLTGISITAPPDKSAYIAGERLDLTGLLVTAQYSNGSSAGITGYASNPAAGAVLDTIGTVSIKISYMGETARFDVTVVKPLEIQFKDTAFYQAVCRLLGKTYGQLIYPGEVEKIKSLDLMFMGIGDLSGIEYFTGLETLLCGFNDLTSLDLTNNTALQILICPVNRLTSLDVSNNPALINLACSSNRLASLDVSNCTALEVLTSENNPLVRLDVSENHALAELYCQNNELVSLDLSGNPALKILDCSYNRLRSLDLTHNRSLRNLSCEYNYMASESDIIGLAGLSFSYYKSSPQNAAPTDALTGITITSPPNKTTYEAGETLNLTGMAVVADYSDGGKKDVTASVVINPANGAVLAESDTDVTVSYTENGVTMKAGFAITVAEPEVIPLTVQPGTIVQGHTSYITVKYDGSLANADFAMLDKDGGVIGSPVKGNNGVAVIAVTAPDEAGIYKIAALIGKKARGMGSIEVVAYSNNLWTAYTTVDKNGFVVINFNEDITVQSNRLTVNGQNATGVVAGGRSIVTSVRYEDLPAGSSVFSVSGVKYPKLYPAYTFTFTATVTKD